MSDIIEQVLQTNIYIQPIHFILIIFINILNIRILCCRVLRSSPCTHYFLAYAIFSIIYTCLLCPTQFVRGFSIFWAIHGKIPCKIHFYILFTVPYQANLMLILASFDRYSSSLNLRRFYSKSTVRIPRIVIILGTLCCVLYMLPMLVICNWDADSKKCLPRSNLIISIYIFSQVVMYYILTPLLMIVFGLLTIANIRRQSARARLRIAINRSRRTEGQLTRMLLLQVGVHLILALPFSITYCMNSFIPSTQTPRMIAIRLAFVTATM
jgi:hypothetical protein